MLYPHMFIKKISFSNDLKKRVIFFAFKDVFNLNVHFFHYKGSSYLRLLFRFKEYCTKRPPALKGLESNGTQLLYQQLY